MDETQLIHIAREGLKIPLPGHYKLDRDLDGRVCYYDTEKQTHQDTNPVDEIYLRKVQDEREY